MTDSQKIELTLASFIQACRFSQGLTQEKFAQESGLPLKVVQDIEDGLDIIIAPSVRQRLAKGLKISPAKIKYFEKYAHQEAKPDETLAKEEQLFRFRQRIISAPCEIYDCPQCDATLIVRQFERRDLEENLIIETKINCSQCLFTLN